MARWRPAFEFYKIDNQLFVRHCFKFPPNLAGGFAVTVAVTLPGGAAGEIIPTMQAPAG
jgi:hypothetical protein